jgi:sec-independent protein translocase protein TatC
VAGWREWRVKRRRAAAAAGADMSFLEHLEELRKVLLFTAAITTAGAVAGWYLADRAIVYLSRDIGVVHYRALTEAFTIKVKVALAVGFVVALPLVLHRLWRFVVPALMPNERRAVFPLVASSLALFYAGVAFAFIVVKPLMIRFFLSFTMRGVLEPVIMVGDYLGFITRLALAFGLVFQLPLAICLLSVAGLVNPVSLARQWRYALVFIFVVSGIATPGTDMISQVALAVPLTLLFFGGILVAVILVRRSDAREARERAAEADAAGPISP